MRKKWLVFVAVFVAFVLAAPAFAKNAKVKMEKPIGEFVAVPDGYMAVVSPSGRSYVLLPGSPGTDFVVSDDRTMLALTEQGQRIMEATKRAADMKKAGMGVVDDLFLENLAGEGISTEGVIEPIMADTDCDETWKCGKLLCYGGHCSCVAVTGCTCSYLHVICTLQ